MHEVVTLAIVACIVIAMVATGYCLGAACSWWDRRRAVKRYQQQRKG